jgi:hypothetical protein
MKERNIIKTLLLDMELTYAIYYAFPSKREQYLSAKNIIHHQFCPCAAWKWDHQVSVHSIKITDDKKRFKKNFRDDFIVAEKLHELMNEADVIVAHNGDAFDIKHANTLFINHGLGPIPEKKSLDTLKAARKYFAFAGNDLDSLSKRFGGTGKNQKPNWYLMTDGDAEQINKAARYCRNDVRELDRVFVNLKPYMKDLVKIRTKTPNHYGIEHCDACGSTRLNNHALGGVGKGVYPRVRCTECGHEMKGDIKLWKKAQHEKAKKDRRFLRGIGTSSCIGN